MEALEAEVCISSSPLDLEDIEDLLDSPSATSHEKDPLGRKQNRDNIVIPKVRKREKQSNIVKTQKPRIVIILFAALDVCIYDMSRATPLGPGF